MSISCTLPARTLHPFQARRDGFKYQPSPLSPLSKPKSSSPQYLKLVTSPESNRIHLSNLEKLLHKEPEAISVDTKPVQKANKNLLENLNLSRLWPESKAAEDMSPGHLTRLKRVLSVTAEYSPRNNLATRWREYHGSGDWSGLLDPLDENLRREVVRYGEFVQSAYHAFHSDPAMSSVEPPLPRRVALPDKSYRVTKSLYATSSVGLPKWVDDVAPDLGWMTQRSSWIGYVAVCDDKREIQRMGRRDVIIALRGTSTCLEWAENVRAQLVPMPAQNDQHSQAQAQAECGFLSLYKTRGAHVPSLSESVVSEIRRLMEVYKGETLSITVTGHSLGAALALLVGDELSTCSPHVPPVAVFSFGGPRAGNKGFADRITKNNVKVLRIVNSQDVITKVPANLVSEAYAHVGTELRVDTKTSPYLKPNADVACCHDLEAYLHLVDGFMGTNCPFRENAKRSLLRLVHEQGSNVKKLYMSKAKKLSSLDVRRGIHVSASCLPSPS